VTRLSAEKGDRANGTSTKSYLLLGLPHGASVLAAVQAAAGFAGACCARSPDCRCARCLELVRPASEQAEKELRRAKYCLGYRKSRSQVSLICRLRLTI
jgi:hypothetical protein